MAENELMSGESDEMEISSLNCGSLTNSLLRELATNSFTSSFISSETASSGLSCNKCDKPTPAIGDPLSLEISSVNPTASRDSSTGKPIAASSTLPSPCEAATNTKSRRIFSLDYDDRDAAKQAPINPAPCSPSTRTTNATTSSTDKGKLPNDTTPANITGSNSKRQLSTSSALIFSAPKRPNPNKPLSLAARTLEIQSLFDELSQACNEKGVPRKWGKNLVFSPPSESAPTMANNPKKSAQLPPELESAQHAPSSQDLVTPSRPTQDAPQPLPEPSHVLNFMDMDFPTLPSPAKLPVFKGNFTQNLFKARMEPMAQITPNRAPGSSTSIKNAATGPVSTDPAKPSNPAIPAPPPRHGSPLIQCHRCQSFGHDKKTCRREFVCMKCSGFHPTTTCRKPRDVPPRCCNCGGQHISAFRGCPTYQSLKHRVYNTGTPRPHRAQGNTQRRHGSGPVRRSHSKVLAERKSSSNYWEPLQHPQSSKNQGYGADKKDHPGSANNKKRHHSKKPTNPFKDHATSTNHTRKNSNRNPAEAHLKRFQANLRSQQSQNGRSSNYWEPLQRVPVSKNLGNYNGNKDHHPGPVWNNKKRFHHKNPVHLPKENTASTKHARWNSRRNPAESHLKRYQANLRSQQSHHHDDPNMRMNPAHLPKEDATSNKHARWNTRRNPAESHLKRFQANLRSQQSHHDSDTRKNQLLENRHTNPWAPANGGKSANHNPAESRLKQFQANLRSQQSQNGRRTNGRAIQSRKPNISAHQKRHTQHSNNWIEWLHSTNSRLDKIERMLIQLMQSSGKFDGPADTNDASLFNDHTEYHSSPIDSVEMHSLTDNINVMGAINANDQAHA
ncbi:hypothetical protein KR074_002445 [Drosophila pseudoananassae]|nr:hypothetical protein KR074_002445 [Drosophila pseudoananassae]